MNADGTFPLDDVTLAVVEVACVPDEEGQSHLFDVLTFGSEPLEPYTVEINGEPHTIEVSAGGWHPNDLVLALIAEVRELRHQIGEARDMFHRGDFDSNPQQRDRLSRFMQATA